MIRTWQKFALVSLFAVVPSLVQAQPEGKKDEPDIKTVVKMLEDLKKDVKDLKKDMKDSFSSVSKDFVDIQNELDKANDRFQGLKKDFVDEKGKVDSLEATVKALREELNGLKKGNGGAEPPSPLSEKAVLEEILARIDALAKMKATNKRDAKSVPLTPLKGKVLLENYYVDDMIFQINDMRFVVPPGQTMLVNDVPAGTFSFKISHTTFGERLREPAAKLEAGKTYKLTATN